MKLKLKGKVRRAKRDISRAAKAKLFNLYIHSPYSRRWLKAGSFWTKQKAIEYATTKYPRRKAKIFHPLGKVVWTSQGKK
ncbi:hypothetical protein ES704_01384 [subsurface metagenome]